MEAERREVSVREAGNGSPGEVGVNDDFVSEVMGDDREVAWAASSRDA